LQQSSKVTFWIRNQLALLCLTAFLDQESTRLALPHGAQGHVFQPYAPAQLDAFDPYLAEW
jgi:hypothetical protein